nr:hypothetical protein BaRGS_008788 [Batillaria attramentaria]
MPTKEANYTYTFATYPGWNHKRATDKVTIDGPDNVSLEYHELFDANGARRIVAICDVTGVNPVTPDMIMWGGPLCNDTIYHYSTPENHDTELACYHTHANLYCCSTHAALHHSNTATHPQYHYRLPENAKYRCATAHLELWPVFQYCRTPTFLHKKTTSINHRGSSASNQTREDYSTSQHCRTPDDFQADHLPHHPRGSPGFGNHVTAPRAHSFLYERSLEMSPADMSAPTRGGLRSVLPNFPKPKTYDA